MDDFAENSTSPTRQAPVSRVNGTSPLGRIISQIRSNDSGLTKVSLFDKGIGDAGAQDIAEALRFNTNLSLLDLGRNGIKDEGASAIASSLQANHTLRMLWLRDNTLGTRGAAALADAISSNKGLAGLSLGRNHISSDGAVDIASALKSNTALKAIWLYGNGVGDLGAKSLADALKVNSSLNELCLGSNGITEDGSRAIAYILMQNTSLTLLELNRNRLGNAGAQALANALSSNSTLTELSLRRNGIQYKGVQALINATLGENVTLSKLDLRDNLITDEEIAMAEGEVARLQPVRRTPCTVLLRTDRNNPAGNRPSMHTSNGGYSSKSYTDRASSRRAVGNADLERGQKVNQEHSALLAGASSQIQPLEIVDKNADEDDIDHDHDHELYDDVYSMLFLAKFGSLPFCFSVVTYLLKTVLFTFVLVDFFSGGYPGNLLNIPSGIDSLVRWAQFFMLPVAVAMQEDLISCMALVNVMYTEDIMKDHPGASHRKWKLSIFCRLTDGLYSLTINFCIIIQANSVLGMMLNFAALHFLQSIDNVAYHLALDGYFGDHVEAVAQGATEAKLPEQKGGWLRSFDTVMFFLAYLACLIAWIVLTLRQMDGGFACESFDANFGNKAYAWGNGNLQLDIFSGTYVQRGNRKDNINSRITWAKSPETEPKGVFAYCKEHKVWGFTVTEDINPCKNILYSSNAEEIYDVTDVSAWYYNNTISDNGSGEFATDFSTQCNEPN